MSAKQYRFFGQVQEVNDKGETIDAGWSCMANWVQYSDYARLKAEVERLRIERNGFKQAMKANQSILETKRVAIERLRKAGDELSWAFAFAVSRDDGKESGLIKAWNAAKEGKQS